MIVANAPLDRVHLEELGDERVARLCPLDGDRAGGAVDPVEVDPVTRSSSVRIWPVKQSFVSKRTTAPGWTSSDRLEVGAERPDDARRARRPRRRSQRPSSTSASRPERGRASVATGASSSTKIRSAFSSACASRRREYEQNDQTERHPRDRDPVPVTEWIVRPVLELVVEREGKRECSERAGRPGAASGLNSLRRSRSVVEDRRQGRPRCR